MTLGTLSFWERVRDKAFNLSTSLSRIVGKLTDMLPNLAYRIGRRYCARVHERLLLSIRVRLQRAERLSAADFLTLRVKTANGTLNYQNPYAMDRILTFNNAQHYSALLNHFYL